MTTYQTYTQALKRFPRLTDAEVEQATHEYEAAIYDSGTRAYTLARETLVIEASLVGIRAAKAAHKRYARDSGAEPSMDLVQEATMAAIAAVDTFRLDGGATFRGWLMRRAYGAALDWLAHERAQGMGGKDHMADTTDVEDLLRHDPDTGEDSPLAYDATAELMDREVAESIEAALLKLEPEIRNIVVSYYGYKAHRLTLAEIAQRERMSIGTVRNRLQAGIEQLQSLLL